MRPDIDMSHTLGGQVKDYAEANDLTLSEACIEVLEADLETLETQDSRDVAVSHRSLRDSRPFPERGAFWCANETLCV